MPSPSKAERASQKCHDVENISSDRDSPHSQAGASVVICRAKGTLVVANAGQNPFQEGKNIGIVPCAGCQVPQVAD
jgi:hypothetical protein